MTLTLLAKIFLITFAARLGWESLEFIAAFILLTIRNFKK